MKQMFVYIVASKKNGTLYTGVTSDILRRAHEHKFGIIKGFSSLYNCTFLVYVESHEDPESAILREKKIKSLSRKKKLKLIENKNPNWKDLYHDILNDCW